MLTKSIRDPTKRNFHFHDQSLIMIVIGIVMENAFTVKYWQAIKCNLFK